LKGTLEGGNLSAKVGKLRRPTAPVRSVKITDEQETLAAPTRELIVILGTPVGSPEKERNIQK